MDYERQETADNTLNKDKTLGVQREEKKGTQDLSQGKASTEETERGAEWLEMEAATSLRWIRLQLI